MGMWGKPTRINFRVHKSKNSFTMVYISPIGRDWGSTVNWDSLGKLYASIAIIWTVILALGSAWLIQNRQLPFLRMRNIPLAITSVCFLHVYLIKILLAYTTNGHFLCSAEFWIMSIYLPFGIALFQANMVNYSVSVPSKESYWLVIEPRFESDEGLDLASAECDLNGEISRLFRRRMLELELECSSKLSLQQLSMGQTENSKDIGGTSPTLVVRRYVGKELNGCPQRFGNCFGAVYMDLTCSTGSEMSTIHITGEPKPFSALSRGSLELLCGSHQSSLLENPGNGSIDTSSPLCGSLQASL